MTRPSDAALEALAARLLAAENPVIMAGNEIVSSDAFDEIARLAEVLGAPVYQQSIPYGAHFPSEHPAFMGALSRVQKQVRDVLTPYDLIVAVGANVLRMSVYSEVDPLPTEMPIVQICLDDWELGKNYPTEMAIRADVKETLAALNPAIEAKGGADHAAIALAAFHPGLDLRRVPVGGGHGAEFFDDGGMGRIAGQVVKLARIGLQVV